MQMNKYRAIRTYSELCGRCFASRAECQRGEELALLQRAGVISDLEYQVRFVLSKMPRVTITIDFTYSEDGRRVYEDAKGVLTRDFRSKMAWLEQRFGIHVVLSRRS